MTICWNALALPLCWSTLHQVVCDFAVCKTVVPQRIPTLLQPSILCLVFALDSQLLFMWFHHTSKMVHSKLLYENLLWSRLTWNSFGHTQNGFKLVKCTCECAKPDVCGLVKGRIDTHMYNCWCCHALAHKRECMLVPMSQTCSMLYSERGAVTDQPAACVLCRNCREEHS